MKKYFCLLILLASLFPARTQEIFEYRAFLDGSSMVPPNASPNVFEGTFRLDGLVLYYSSPYFDTSFTPSSAIIFGPALAGQTGPELFSLNKFSVGPYFTMLPDGTTVGDAGGTSFFGSRTLTTQEIEQLNAGLWYMTVNTAAYPNGELRGQILVVPEPATTSLLIGAGVLLLRAKFRRRR